MTTYMSQTEYKRLLLIKNELGLAEAAESEDEIKKHLAVAWGAQLRQTTLTHADRMKLTVNAY